jgi:hypothetical protein
MVQGNRKNSEISACNFNRQADIKDRIAMKRRRHRRKKKWVRFFISLATKRKVMTPVIIVAGISGINIKAVLQDSESPPNILPVSDLASPPVWKSSDPTIAVVVPSADGSNANVIPATPPKGGTVQINYSAEGDPTPGKDTITGEQDVIVVLDEATQVQLQPGPVTPLAQLTEPPANS